MDYATLNIHSFGGYKNSSLMSARSSNSVQCAGFKIQYNIYRSRLRFSHRNRTAYFK